MHSIPLAAKLTTTMPMPSADAVATIKAPSETLPTKLTSFLDVFEEGTSSVEETAVLSERGKAETGTDAQPDAEEESAAPKATAPNTSNAEPEVGMDTTAPAEAGDPSHRMQPNLYETVEGLRPIPLHHQQQEQGTYTQPSSEPVERRNPTVFQSGLPKAAEHMPQDGIVFIAQDTHSTRTPMPATQFPQATDHVTLLKLGKVQPTSPQTTQTPAPAAPPPAAPTQNNLSSVMTPQPLPALAAHQPQPVLTTQLSQPSLGTPHPLVAAATQPPQPALATQLSFVSETRVPQMNGTSPVVEPAQMERSKPINAPQQGTVLAVPKHHKQSHIAMGPHNTTANSPQTLPVAGTPTKTPQQAAQPAQLPQPETATALHAAQPFMSSARRTDTNTTISRPQKYSATPTVPNPNNVVSKPAIVMSPVQWTPPSEKAATDGQLADRPFSDLVFTSTRLDAAQAPAAVTYTARADLPPHLARQLADVVAQTPSRPVDIVLSPEELGRVRLTVKVSDTGIVVNVLAERPETLDLLRRNIDQLGQDFVALGYDNIAFAFSGGDTDPDPQNSPEHTHDSTLSANAPEADGPQIELRSTATNGLDLRL